MAKRIQSRSGIQRSPAGAKVLDFKVPGWSKYRKPTYYLDHLTSELKRLNLDLNERDLVPLHAKPIHELLEWRDRFPNQAYADLHDWRTYDLQVLVERDKALRGSRSSAKPRIDIVAEITTKHNLSVKWYPTGYFDGHYDWGKRGDGFTLNVLRGMRFDQPIDFCYFIKDSSEWGARPPNELMFLRGVGELHIDDSPFSDAIYKFSSLEEGIICAVRANFIRLIEHLMLTMDVTLRTDFEFDIYEEDDADSVIPDGKIQRVQGWRIVDARPKAPVIPLNI